MKRIASLLVLLLAIVLMVNCKKNDDNNNGYNIAAYTQTDSTDVFLYINEQNKGQLPFSADGIEDCGDSKALNISLDPGTYAIAVKDQQGAVKNALVLQVAEDASINTGNNYTLVQLNKCIILGLDY